MPTAPYPILQDVLNTARVRLNDAIQTPAGAPSGQIGGEVIGDLSIFTQQGTNAAWQRFQEELANLGYSKFQKEVILTGLVPKTALDPSTQVFIDWTGYNNGTVLDPTVALPQDLILPWFLWERQSGVEALFCEMCQWLDGMPNTPLAFGFNRIWDWRNDAIYMPGANLTTDIRMRYAAYLGDFVDTGSPVTPWYEQPVPIMRSLDPLAWYIASEFANSRGDMDGTLLDQKALAATQRVFNRDARQKQRVNVRRLSRSGRLDGDGYGNQWGGYSW